MTIAASRVKALCTPAEIALIRASRKGQLENLGPDVLKKNAAQAKKLADKWRDLGRGQSRARSRATGLGEHDSNTKVKEQIFRDALVAYEAQLASVTAAGTPAPKGAKAKTKRDRNAEHRATRAAVRKGMAAVEDLLNAEKPRPKKPSSAKAKSSAAKAPTPAPTPAPVAAKAAPPAAAQPVESKKPKFVAPRGAKAPPPRPAQRGIAVVTAVDQRKAVTAAKKSRIARSGKTTRLAAHIKSHGKRTQARRDAKN